MVKTRWSSDRSRCAIFRVIVYCLRPLSYCYAIQFSLQLVSKRWERNSIASCRRQVTLCNFGLQLAMFSRNTLQSRTATCNVFRKHVEFSDCNLQCFQETRCNLGLQLAMFSRNTLNSRTATSNAFKKHVAIADCNLHWFQKSLQLLQRVQLSSTLCCRCKPQKVAR